MALQRPNVYADDLYLN